MRIARYTTGEDPRFGVVEEDSGAGAVIRVVAGDPLYTPLAFTGERVPLDDVRLLAPVIPRSKVVGVGGNYVERIADTGDAPSEPVVFLKPNTSVIGPGDPIPLPAQSKEVHCEGELAVVIGRLCRDVPHARVSEVVIGYTCANDVTARDLQRRDGQWWRAKGFDGFCPLGPYLVTGLDPADLRITTRVEGRTVQDARSSQLVFGVAALVSYVSAVMTLLPGDVILTGAPAGAGPMRDGQRVEVEVEGIGVLVNPVARDL